MRETLFVQANNTHILQEVVGENPAGSGYGAQMLLTFVDAEAFASVLYPVAYGGVLRLLTPNTTDNYVDFPIADFASGSDGTTPVGILVNPPDSTTDLYKPFNSRGVTTAGIYKDGEHLAVVLEAGFPYPIAEA